MKYLLLIALLGLGATANLTIIDPPRLKVQPLWDSAPTGLWAQIYLLGGTAEAGDYFIRLGPGIYPSFAVGVLGPVIYVNWSPNVTTGETLTIKGMNDVVGRQASADVDTLRADSTLVTADGGNDDGWAWQPFNIITFTAP